jgi:predicted Fe-Mo cluster-binding NifX family protein
LAHRLLIIAIVKIAIPHWQGRISPVFDVSENLVLIDIEGGREQRRENVILQSRDPFRRAKEVSGLGAKVVLCGAVSHELEHALAGAGVEVVGFVCGDLEAVVTAFLRGELADGGFLMPGRLGERQSGRIRRGRRKR